MEYQGKQKLSSDFVAIHYQKHKDTYWCPHSFANPRAIILIAQSLYRYDTLQEPYLKQFRVIMNNYLHLKQW